MTSADIIVIGAGVAGLSVGAELAASAKVIVLEAESATAYHATGRSAAAFGRGYGNATIRTLSEQSAPFFECPPADFCGVPLLKPRPWIIVARDDQRSALAKTLSEVKSLTAIDAAEVIRRSPLLREGYAIAGAVDEDCGDLDVDALVQGFSRRLRTAGGTIVIDARVTAAVRAGGLWRIYAGGERYEAAIVVNAAGAWADQVASLFGVEPLGLTPRRRTAILVEAPPEIDVARLPVTLDAEEQFYFKPEAGKLLISPADETPVSPSDVQADEYDVALAVDRFQSATGLEVRRVSHRWAGLRTFANDRSPVVGYDPRTEGFFWLAGQGGYGVQTCPAMARLAARLALGNLAPSDNDLTVALAPRRLISAALSQGCQR